MDTKPFRTSNIPNFCVQFKYLLTFSLLHLKLFYSPQVCDPILGMLLELPIIRQGLCFFSASWDKEFATKEGSHLVKRLSPTEVANIVYLILSFSKEDAINVGNPFAFLNPLLLFLSSFILFELKLLLYFNTVLLSIALTTFFGNWN